MPNDDRLERLIASPETLREYIPALQAEAERAKQLQEKITAMEHGMKYYIERNIELAEQYQDMKRAVECWVTRAGVLEARMREQDQDMQLVADAQASLIEAQIEIEKRLETKDELLWWVTALACQGWPDGVQWDVFDRLIRPLIQALAPQGYTREGLEKRNGCS